MWDTSIREALTSQVLRFVPGVGGQRLWPCCGLVGHWGGDVWDDVWPSSLLQQRPWRPLWADSPTERQVPSQSVWGGQNLVEWIACQESKEKVWWHAACDTAVFNAHSSYTFWCWYCNLWTISQFLGAGLSWAYGHTVADSTKPRDSESLASLFSFYRQARHSGNITW